MSQKILNTIVSQSVPVKNMHQLMTLTNSSSSHLHSLRDDAWVLPEVQKLLEEKIDTPYPNPLVSMHSAQYWDQKERIYSEEEKQIIWNALCEGLALISKYDATKTSHDLVKSLKHFTYYTITSLTKIGDYMVRYDIHPSINDFIAIHSQVGNEFFDEYILKYFLKESNRRHLYDIGYNYSSRFCKEPIAFETFFAGFQEYWKKYEHHPIAQKILCFCIDEIAKDSVSSHGMLFTKKKHFFIRGGRPFPVPLQNNKHHNHYEDFFVCMGNVPHSIKKNVAYLEPSLKKKDIIKYMKPHYLETFSHKFKDIHNSLVSSEKENFSKMLIDTTLILRDIKENFHFVTHKKIFTHKMFVGHKSILNNIGNNYQKLCQKFWYPDNKIPQEEIKQYYTKQLNNLLGGMDWKRNLKKLETIVSNGDVGGEKKEEKGDFDMFLEQTGMEKYLPTILADIDVDTSKIQKKIQETIRKHRIPWDTQDDFLESILNFGEQKKDILSKMGNDYAQFIAGRVACMKVSKEIKTKVYQTLGHYHILAESAFLETYVGNTQKNLIETTKISFKDFSSETTQHIAENFKNFEIIDSATIIKHHVKSEFTRIIDSKLEPLRKMYTGLLPIGAKIHFQKALSQEKIDDFINTHHFSSTPFQMIHANKSMLIPPCHTSIELIAIIKKLQENNLLEEGNPDMQVCIAGRLPNRHAAILGTATIWLSDIVSTYTPESFSTTHNGETGARIMAYDAGVLDTSFPYMPNTIKGRTDMLGRANIKDIEHYQWLGSLVVASYYGGLLEELGKSFVNEYENTLNKYGYGYFLEQGWIYDQENKENIDTGAVHHSNMLNECARIRKECEPIIIDVAGLFSKYQGLIQKAQTKFLTNK